MSLRLTFCIALGFVILSPSFAFSQCQRGQQGGAGGQARGGSSFTASRLSQMVGTSTMQTTVPTSLLLQRQLQLQLLLQQQQMTQQMLLLQQQQVYQNLLLQSEASLRQQLLNTNAYVRLIAAQELTRRGLLSQSAQ